MHSGANHDDRLPPEDDPGASSDEDSSAQIIPSPAHHKKKKNRHACNFEDCKMTFDRPSALTQHMRSHTGERPHGCEYCRRGFSTASNMRRHLPNCPVRRRQAQHAAPRTPSTSSSVGPRPSPGAPGFPTPPWQPPATGYQSPPFEPNWPPSTRTTPGYPPWQEPGPAPMPGVTAPIPRGVYPSGPMIQPSYGPSYSQADSQPRRFSSTLTDPQREGSLHPSRPFLEPSWPPSPPNPWTGSRLPEAGPAPRASTAETITPRDGPGMQWSPSPTVEPLRDSESRYGSLDDPRAATSVGPQYYSSTLEVQGQFYHPEPQNLGTQTLPQASPLASTPGASSSTGRPWLSENVGALGAVSQEPVQSEPEVTAVPEYMEYVTRPSPWSRRRDPRASLPGSGWSPSRGASYWNSIPPRSGGSFPGAQEDVNRSEESGGADRT